MSINKELTVMHAPEALTVPLRSYQEKKELSIHELFHILMRRRWILMATISLFFVSMLLYCLFCTRRYEATAQVQVDNDAQTASLGLDDSSSGQQGASPDAMEDGLTIQTQAKVLESDTLALKVIKDLNLEPTEDFQPSFNPINYVLSLFTPDGPSDPAGVSLDDAPKRRYNVLYVFSSNLTIKAVPGTRLINISYQNPNPRLAAAVVNHLTKGLVDFNFQTRHDATARTADWLAGQLSDLRKESQELQGKVAVAQRDSGVFTLGGSDAQGREQVYSAVLDKLQQATTAYMSAQANRIAKGAVYQAAKTGDVEAISGLSGSGIASGTTGLDNALVLIQKLREDVTNVKAQLADLSAKFGPAYPKLAELRAQRDAMESSISTEVQRLSDRAKNDSVVADQVDANTQRQYLEAKHQADALNDKIIQYTILRQEADESRTLYETLFKQLKQAGVLADFHSNNISIVDPARAPAKPKKPKVFLYLLGSIMGGFLVGCCAAIARDTTDRKIQNLAELESALGTTPLGVLPFYKRSRTEIRDAIPRRPTRARGSGLLGSRTTPQVKYNISVKDNNAARVPNFALPNAGGAIEIPAFKQPNSAYTEAVRALRTSLLLSRSGSPPKVVLVTSSVAAEGKSMLSLNLAVLLSQQGKKVLLVDADLRRPGLHRALKMKNTQGLSSYLAGQGEDDALSVVNQNAESPNLFVVTSGPVPPYPSELLGSEQMRAGLRVWRDHFDFVVIDGAPVLPVTDSVVLSTMVDFTLLLARFRVTERQSLDRSIRLLQGQTNLQKIGIVLNAVSQDASAYYQYYGYRDSKYLTKDSHEVA